MRLGLLTASASRKAGGLFWALTALAGHLRDQGCQVQVFSGRDECSEKDLIHWDNVPLRLFKIAGPAAFGYAPGLSSQLIESSVDVLHTHGLWMYPSVVAKSWGRNGGRPWVASPHGMLDPWALRNSGWKKYIAGLLYENRHLRGASCLHALCDSEADAFRTYGLRNPIAIIPNGVELPQPPEKPLNADWAQEVQDDARVLLFLGRLHPKKGLPALLKAWSHVSGLTDSPWFLVVAGWDQNGHRAELERLAVSLGIEETVRFVGPQFGEQKVASLSRADAFVLPSFSEGLPMAVLEAWGYQLPVLMTPHCNLPEGFAARAAVALEPEAGSICRALTTLFAMSDEARKQMGSRGRCLVAKRFNWPTVASDMQEVYRWLNGDADRPSCVSVD